MRSLFMYILQSDNYFTLLVLFLYMCLHLASSHLDLLVPHITPLCVTLICGDHTTRSFHILRRSHYWSLNPHLQVHWPCWFLRPHSNWHRGRSSDHPRQESDLPHHARTDEFNYTSMEAFLVQVKILSLVDSAGWW